jgi:hypothetical protein
MPRPRKNPLPAPEVPTPRAGVPDYGPGSDVAPESRIDEVPTAAGRVAEFTDREMEKIASMLDGTMIDPFRYVKHFYKVDLDARVLERIKATQGVFQCPTCNHWRQTTERTATGCRHDGRRLNG